MKLLKILNRTFT